MSSKEPRVEQATIARLLERQFLTSPDGIFLVWDDYEGGSRVWTYSQGAAEIASASQRVQAISTPDRSPLLVIGEPTPALLFHWLACLASGVPVAMINPKATEQEISRYLAALAPAGVIHDASLTELVGSVASAAGLSVQMMVLDSNSDPDAGSSEWPGYWQHSQPGDRAGFIFTSGTTGAPKAVVLSQANYAWGSAVCSSYFRLRGSDRLVVLLPLFHVNAQVYSVLSAIQAAASIVLAPRLSISRFWPLVDTHSITKVSMSIFGMEVIARAGRATPTTLQLVASGTQRARWVEGWGSEVLSMYGSSETVAPPILGTTSEAVPEGFIGRVTPFYAVRVIPDSASAQSIQGSLEVAGIPGWTLAQGYVFADGTSHSLDMTEDGWFRTGDVVECDTSGWFRFLGRADDVLKVRGENVSPAEIEDAIRGSTGVKDVAVVGQPDVVWGHIPVAVLELSEGAHPEEVTQSVLARLSERLTPQKHPQLFFVAHELPRSNLNKVKKSVVRESLSSYEEVWRSADYERRI